LPGPGMTLTVGPIGVCAQAANSRVGARTPDVLARQSRLDLIDDFPNSFG
jgi:hypothetical protein